MGAMADFEESGASPSSPAELRRFLAQLRATDTNGDHTFSADELALQILKHYKAEHANEADPFKQLRDDIAAYRALPVIRAKWQTHDPSVTAQMVGAATTAAENAEQRLGELLGHEPERIAGILRENTGDLAALKLNQIDAQMAEREARREAAADAAQRAATQREIETAVPPNMRGHVKGITNTGGGTQAAIAEAMKNPAIANDPRLADPAMRELLGLPPLSGARTAAPTTLPLAPIAAFGSTQQELMDLRKQIAAYKPEHVDRLSLGTLEKALANMTPQTTNQTKTP
jgi:hypothetical protein